MSTDPPDKVHVLTALTILEINIGPGPNAWGYTAEVVDQRGRKKTMRGMSPQLVIYDEVEEVNDGQRPDA